MSGQPTVLLVEDDPDLLRFAQVTLRLGGYHAVTATDGQKAVAAARRRAPDLVLLDLRLPRLSGRGVLAALQADPRPCMVPVVMLTASAGPEAHERARSAGVADYLHKPVSADELLAAVERGLLGAPPAPRA